jgi:FkbM family methyltransferase
MKYDFIEIGTADFDTEIQNHNGRIGLSVDIIQEYLDNLPNIENVKKICCGISDTSGEVVSYKPQFPTNFPNWLRGCVSIINPHKHVIEYCTREGIDYNNYIIKRNVPIISVSDFVKQYDIEEVEYLKIDTEGHDCVILNAWLDVCATNSHLYPKRILYESKDLTNINDIMNMRTRLISLNYRLNILEYDTEATLIKVS